MSLGMDMFFRSAALLLLGFCLLFQTTCIGARSATLSLGQSLSPGQSLISPGGKFELGFFSFADNSSDSYIAIWYKTIPEQTVVWVLNRDNPILNSSSSNAKLMLSGANLQLFNDARQLIWSTNVSSTVSNTTQAMLLDTGNFVVKNDVFTYWQSFDYPTDTLLPGMKFGFDETSGKNITLSSWRSKNQPGTGLFSLQMDPSGNGEFFIRKNSSQTFWSSGPWDGEGFPSITRGLGSNTLNLSYDGKYLLYSVGNDSIISRIVMTTPGALQLLVWTESTENWNVFLSIPSDICERLGFCGDYGICDISESPVCGCLIGFVPKSTKYWELGDFSGGCVRKSPLHCNSNEDGFLKISNVKWPASSQPLELGSIEMCRDYCSYNCKCNAYAYSSNGRCLFWNEQLLDLERLGNRSTGGDWYLKYPTSDISVFPPTGAQVLPPTGHKRSRVTAIAASIASVLFVCCTCLCYFWRRNRKRKGVKETTQNQNQNQNQNLLLFDLNGDVAAPNASSTLKDSNGMDKYKNYELPMFSFPSVALATDNFSIANKLGEGGFGPVYKGKLLNDQLVAIKRLSKRSGQGLKEFRTETELIAKLQHRNLVRILGCCIELEEMILIYEYMPNKSLDSFLFVPTNQDQLDWTKRVHIIEGIAQGLLYLHHYSRLRIVHRDLKASNILLDGEMNPKISDFGLARIFGGNELQANTDRIVGTYGYMSPEYAMEGLFSVKSDVFAFGVLLLEIISGKKNTGFYGADCLSLLGHAWELWTNDKVLELLDPVLQVNGSSASPDRYIAIGLLCVQERPADRPAMSEVVAMLSNDQATLASPKQPAFTAGRTVVVNAAGEVQICSANKLTFSVMAPR